VTQTPPASVAVLAGRAGARCAGRCRMTKVALARRSDRRGSRTPRCSRAAWPASPAGTAGLSATSDRSWALRAGDVPAPTARRRPAPSAAAASGGCVRADSWARSRAPGS